MNLLVSFNQSNEKIDLTNYITDYRKYYRHKILKTKKLFYSDKIRNSINKPRTIWGIINNQSKKIKKNKTARITAEEFNNFFVNVPKEITTALKNSNSNSYNPSKFIHNNHTIFLKPAETCEISNIIKSLSNSTALDIFGLSNKIIKKLEKGLTIPLTIIINKCFSFGSFPDRLKVSKVCPIFKGGDENDKNNYRPVSITPVFSKPIEICLSNRLISFFRKM